MGAGHGHTRRVARIAPVVGVVITAVTVTRRSRNQDSHTRSRRYAACVLAPMVTCLRSRR